MFPGRPVPQQQNPWELAPEVYVARGRNLGRDEGYDEGYHEGWNDAVDKANRILGRATRCRVCGVRWWVRRASVFSARCVDPKRKKR